MIVHGWSHLADQQQLELHHRHSCHILLYERLRTTQRESEVLLLCDALMVEHVHMYADACRQHLSCNPNQMDYLGMILGMILRMILVMMMCMILGRILGMILL